MAQVDAAETPADPSWPKWRTRALAVGGAVVTAGLVAIAAFGVGVVTDLIAWIRDPIRVNFDLPATWTAIPDSYPGEPPLTSLPRIILSADGTAEVRDLPTGSLGERDGALCFENEGTYTGPAAWAATEGGRLRIESDDVTILWAETGFFGSLYWTELRLAECGTDPLIMLGGPPYR
ncbi:hypothetical protein OVN18_13030 [Microcella daejeonensis]|uniref:Uncharacterized protein n=1 Tax=Microcella daejeonensis TaxID=2994971 RepID=A0A9E8MLZ3_9MICO|nr:hypothetical protein [Microcella daejeonensis]WAB81437.1 hypothetical protein OVN18_13030 [Microcella daejeonensis]WAB83599.1 hypothetical protein OVN20_11155 [Microcella daejeonensis]